MQTFSMPSSYSARCDRSPSIRSRCRCRPPSQSKVRLYWAIDSYGRGPRWIVIDWSGDLLVRFSCVLCCGLGFYGCWAYVIGLWFSLNFSDWRDWSALFCGRSGTIIICVWAELNTRLWLTTVCLCWCRCRRGWVFCSLLYFIIKTQ